MAITSLVYKLLGAGNDDKANAEPVMLTGIIVATGWDGNDQAGWLYCDGRSLLRADYPALFTAISTRFGTADGTHFNIPDLRGRFVRGFDDGQGRDPDAASRTAMTTGGNTGDNVGSVQADAHQGHWHKVKQRDGGSFPYAHRFGAAISPGGSGLIAEVASEDATTYQAQDVFTDGVNGTPRTSSETRPLNVALAYYIKT